MKKQPKVNKEKAKKNAEDKTFGIKNKKGAQTQKQIKGLQSQALRGGMSEDKLIQLEFEKKKAKEEKAKEQALMASLFGNTTAKAGQIKKEVKVEDPKLKVCAFFKQGLCQKGRKCKYSHDLTLEQEQGKTQAIDLYTDQREQLKLDDKKEDTIENWDTEKLNEVVRANQNQYKSQKPTEIVCKYFLDAINNGKYGWKWVCPNNGMKCHYRHCLPPGFVLKKDQIKEKQRDESKLEEEIDQQIQALGVQKGSPKVTLEVFQEWKKKRDIRIMKEREERMKERQKTNKKKTGGKNFQLTGLAMFKKDVSLFQDADDAGDDDIDYGKREDADNDKKVEEEENNDIQEQNENEEEDQEEEKRNDEEIQQQQENQQENKEEDNQKQEKQEEAVENWEEAATEDEQKKKKKKNKKKKKSGDVDIDDNVFLQDA